ncbi:MAG: hypothetical protein AAGI52_10230 [Bacteroidota bacterium]
MDEIEDLVVQPRYGIRVQFLRLEDCEGEVVGVRGRMGFEAIPVLR